MSCPTHANGSNAGQPCQPTQPAKPMQAISAILNPDTVGREGGKEKVFVFQSLPNRTVGMDQINFGDKSVNNQKDEGDGVVGYYAKPPSFVPVLRPGSKLVSTVFDDIVHVYGINEQTGLISLVSPIFSPVKNAKPEYNNFAACSNANDDGKGYLYFQKKNERGVTYIYEKDLSDPDSEPSLVDKTNEAEEGTDMIAFHDGENRWIVYQTSSGRGEKNIVLHDVDSGKKDQIPNFGNNIASGEIARIAAVHARTAKDREDLVFVYLAATKNQLWRSQATITDGTPNFASAKKLSKDTYINDWTSMSVVADPVKRENLIFTITEKGNSISLNRDVWGKQ
ncbi:Ff.00g117590.m01.CDS01 [Fusarium sp. VM40]|nr:Ff.00g117590.m01.CDS01 [Fusarium sp. VM40]